VRGRGQRDLQRDVYRPLVGQHRERVGRDRSAAVTRGGFLCERTRMGEVKTMTRLYALGISMVMSSGCMMVPARYREPIRSYPTPAPKTVAIEGFNVGGFQPTGYTTSTSFGTASATGSGGYASGSYVGSGLP